MKPRLSLKGRALQLLAQREHSRLELRRKLLAHAEKSAEDEAAKRGDERVATHAEDDAGDGRRSDVLARRPTPTPAMQANVERLLDELAAGGLLSEARFVEGRIRTRAARHGNQRIAQELARHGLQPSADAARELKASEFARAREVWLRKFGDAAAASATDARSRARQIRCLAGRGFSAEVIRRVLRAGTGED